MLGSAATASTKQRHQQQGSRARTGAHLQGDQVGLMLPDQRHHLLVLALRVKAPRRLAGHALAADIVR